MRVQRYAEATELLHACAPTLRAAEAENNLVLGLLAGLRAGTTRSDGPPYLAVVFEGARVLCTALMTPPHNLVLSLCRDVESLSLLARDLRSFTQTVPGVLAEKETAELFCAVWREQTGEVARLTKAERIYELREVRPVVGVSGRMRRARADERDLLVTWTVAFMEESGTAVGDAAEAAVRSVAGRLTARPDEGGLFLWDDGEAVALAGYSGPTPTGIRVGPVYTPPPLRGRGYASALVAALSEALLAGGRQRCFLFTDLSNPTSNKIYRQIGYVPVCDADQYAFSAPAQP